VGVGVGRARWVGAARCSPTGSFGSCTATVVGESRLNINIYIVCVCIYIASLYSAYAERSISFSTGHLVEPDGLGAHGTA
jgi:hypothetical protein